MQINSKKKMLREEFERKKMIQNLCTELALEVCIVPQTGARKVKCKRQKEGGRQRVRESL